MHAHTSMCTLMHGVHPEALLTRVSHCIDGERHLSTRPPSSFARGSGDGFIDPYEFERGLRAEGVAAEILEVRPGEPITLAL